LELIVDANILVASFLKDAQTRELLVDARLNLFAPEHLISETSRQLKRGTSLRKRIHLSEEALQELVRILTQKIQLAPFQSYKLFLREALSLAPHEEDAPYLALALALNIPIWSNDKGLMVQKAVTVYSTSELIYFLGRMSG